ALERGWSVIPLQAGSKVPQLTTWKPFQQHAPQRAQVDDWLRKWPGANVGIVTGAVSGLVVLDVDGLDGALALVERGPLPPTPTVETPHGRHYYFKHPGGTVRNFAGRWPGLDRRGDG